MGITIQLVKGADYLQWNICRIELENKTIVNIFKLQENKINKKYIIKDVETEEKIGPKKLGHEKYLNWERNRKQKKNNGIAGVCKEFFFFASYTVRKL